MTTTPQATPGPPGGTYQHMHEVLDGLNPKAAVVALEREFTRWHVHLTDTLAVWAETTMGPGGGGAPVTVRASNALQIWGLMAAEEWHWWIAGAALAGRAGAA